MESLKNSVQVEFEKFKEKYKDDLLRFIWYKDDAEFVLDEKAETFYFSPKEKKVGIPLKRLEEYFYLLNSDDEAKLNLHKIDWKFWLAHEFSHFRDMLKEQDISKDSSMYRVLKKLSNRKIKISEKKCIPIGKMIHDIYNSIDDIIVNYEVMNFMRFWITKDVIKEIYQRKLFPDYEEQPDWTTKLNLDKPVDYSKRPDYTAISYYFLRKKMVPNQKIILSDNLNSILFNDKGRNIPWSTSLKNLKKLFNTELEKAKNSDDPKVKDRYEKLKSALNNQVYRLEQIDKLKIQKLLWIALKSLSNYDITRLSVSSMSLESIINLFTMSKWWDDWHILCILPDLRYQIYEAIFEPIIETLILIYCLHNDIKDGWDWWEDWGEDWDDNNDEDKNGKEESWEGSYSRSLEDALKFIEESAEYNQDKKREAQRKKDSEKVWKSIIEVLKDKWVSPEAWKFKEEVQKNFSGYIEQITKILYDELYAVDVQNDTTNIISKKWTLNYDEFMKEFSKSFVDWDFSEKSIYDRKRNIEKIKEEFKKLSFYFMIDVSGSTEWFKWRYWLLNGIPISLALSIKNVERAIQNLSGDPTYEIPIKFILYTNEVNYFTKDEDLSDMEAEITRVNSAIARISWWTEDRHGWTIVWEKLAEDFKNHPEYLDDIKSWKLKPVVVQIADNDVSESWVEWLEDVINKDFWEEIKNALTPKRIILWEERMVERPEDSVQKWWNWTPEYVRWPDWRILTDKDWHKMVRVKEIWVRSKEDIIDGIKVLFKNFFGDMIKEKI